MEWEASMINRMIHGEIHELRLNRPPVNALSPDLLQFLADEVRRSPQQGARALILSGREGVFSGGLDVPVLLELEREELRGALASFFDAIEALASSVVPVAAAITGHSPAGGAVLSLCCDWRVMAEGDYTIGLNEVRVGIPIPSLVGRLASRALGARTSEQLCVSGRLMGPEEALETGFVDELAPVGDVVFAARRWCSKIIEAPPEALAETRSMLRRDLVEAIREGRDKDIRLFTDRWFEAELQSSMRALVAQLKGG
jgi:enoyl-CoA hydratase/carnithine racemase